MSFGRAITWLAAQDPDRPAMLHEGTRLSRGELEAGANRLARAYARLGVGAGDLVTVALPNGIEFYEACLAIWRLGATPNPISARLPAAERRAIVDTAAPALVVGVAPGEYGERPSVPAGFEPEPGDGDAPLPDRVSAAVRAMTSGGTADERLARAREVIRLEAKTIADLEHALDASFDDAVGTLIDCKGKVVVTSRMDNPF